MLQKYFEPLSLSIWYSKDTFSVALKEHWVRFPVTVCFRASTQGICSPQSSWIGLCLYGRQNVRNVLNSNPVLIFVCPLRIGPRSEANSWRSWEPADLSLWETSPLTPCPSRWPPAFLALTGTTWDKDVCCHGDHIQENTGKEGCRRCNIQKYRFGPGERLFSTCVSTFFCLCVMCHFMFVALPTCLMRLSRGRTTRSCSKSGNCCWPLVTPQQFYGSTWYFPNLSTLIRA